MDRLAGIYKEGRFCSPEKCGLLCVNYTEMGDAIQVAKLERVNRHVGLPLFQMEEGMVVTSFLCDGRIEFPSHSLC